MSIFNKKQPATQLPPLLTDAEIDGASYDQVIEFLTSVNDDDFAKITNVATIYRKAHLDVAQATGMVPEPVQSIFDTQTVAPVLVSTETDTEAGNFLTDDDKDIADALDIASLNDPAKPTQNAS